MIGMIPFSLIEDLINESLGLLYKNDKYLLDIDAENIPAVRNDDEKHVGERAAMFRFAYYMQSLVNDYNKYSLFRNYNFDCEYNRNIYKVKRLPNGKNIVPDIIIHKRGNNDNNLLIIELKTWWNENNSGDIEKLDIFTDKSGCYGYEYGLSCTLQRKEKSTKNNLIWFSEGKEIKKNSSKAPIKPSKWQILGVCQEMFRHACAFSEVADMAQDEFKHDTADINWYTMPAAVNSAFTYEVFLKALLHYSGISAGNIHDLKSLFKKLPEGIKNWVKETVKANNGGMWKDWRGVEYLDNISKAFVDWRYIYEHYLNGSVSIRFETGFLKVFRNTLREACCQLFFKKTWEEYKQ